MPVATLARDVKIEQSEIEKLGIEKLRSRVQEFRSVCAQSEWKVNILEDTGMITKDYHRQIIADHRLRSVRPPGDIALSLINHWELATRLV